MKLISVIRVVVKPEVETGSQTQGRIQENYFGTISKLSA